MFEWCSSHVMSTSSPARESLAEARGDQVDRLGRAAREDDLGRRRGVDEASDFFSRAFVGGRRALAQLMHAAMHVRVVQALLQRHRLVNRRRGLARGGVVEIGQRLAVHELLQRREVFAERREVALQPRCGAFCGGHDHCSVKVPSRAVTCSSTRVRRSSSAICSTTVVANAVVSKRRAVSRVEPACAQVEQLLGVELADGRAVAALDVVGVDLELGLGVDLRVLAEQQVVVALPRIDLLAAGLDDDLAVEDAAAALADDAAEVLAADGGAGRVADQRVVVDVLTCARRAAGRTAPSGQQGRSATPQCRCERGVRRSRSSPRSARRPAASSAVSSDVCTAPTPGVACGRARFAIPSACFSCVTLLVQPCVIRVAVDEVLHDRGLRSGFDLEHDARLRGELRPRADDNEMNRRAERRCRRAT